MTYTFSRFAVAVVTPDQQAKMTIKASDDSWFYTYGIPSRIHNNPGKNFSRLHYKAAVQSIWY